MFMRFRGGAVGHKGMRDWDDILQREGHIPEDSDDEAEEDIQMTDHADEEFDVDDEDIAGEDEADESDDEEDEDDDDDGDDDDEDEDEDDEDDEDDILRDDEEDKIIAEDGEELDDNILMEEGYGAL